VSLGVRQLEDRLTPSLTTLAAFGFPNGSTPYDGLVRDGRGNLYGTAFVGGASNDGTVFELAHGSGTLTTLASFNGTNGVKPVGSLVLDSSGNLYGTASGGGASNDGTIFEVAKGSRTITTLASFNGTDGATPSAGLILDGSGNLYGTTIYGGASGDGAVFEVTKGSGKITTLASFNGTDGDQPSAVILDGSGNLYGTTYEGGASNDGTVFELAHGSGTITTLASFDGTDGANSIAALVIDGNGNLYGTTSGGGASGAGTVFEVARASGAITTLASFDGTDGEFPLAGLTMDSGGNLYGTTEYGGASDDGTVFELVHGSGTITTLASFDGTDGAEPRGGLVLDGSGNLYGTAWTGGAAGAGTVIEVAAGSGTITTLASFDGTSAASPQGGLVMDSAGNLYGTTALGGTVFELAQGTGAVTTLATFNGANGLTPKGALVMDGSGNLYGTTYHGGASGYGTVFELAHGSGTITTLASFSGSDGSYPLGGLVIDGGGNLYGTTESGGAPNEGTVFELAQGSSTITTLASFDITNGANPYAGLLMDSQGNLYGTAALGGASNDGTVFEVAKGSGTITTLASFDGKNGSTPEAPLIMDGSGNLYGTTAAGGASKAGTVFELAQGASKITTRASFNGKNGSTPVAGLVMNGGGNLYGTTLHGGASGEGTVFELATGATKITTLTSFKGANGAYPVTGLLLDGSGNLYGTTDSGGAGAKGTVFELPAAAAAPLAAAGPLDRAGSHTRRAGRTLAVSGLSLSSEDTPTVHIVGIDWAATVGPSASSGRPVACSRRPRLLWLLARSWRSSGRVRKSAARCFRIFRAWS
jgi:uncharacterized repeat protein (TIGR03803 family)